MIQTVIKNATVALARLMATQSEAAEAKTFPRALAISCFKTLFSNSQYMRIFPDHVDAGKNSAQGYRCLRATIRRDLPCKLGRVLGVKFIRASSPRNLTFP